MIWYYSLYHEQRLALKRLIDISMGVITPLSEQLTKPLPNALVLVNLKELSTGAYKLLPEGATKHFTSIKFFHERIIFLFISLSWAHSITALTFISCFIFHWFPLRFTFGCVFTWRWALWRARNPQRHWCYHASSWTTLYWRKNQQSACSEEVITDKIIYKFHK